MLLTKLSKKQKRVKKQNKPSDIMIKTRHQAGFFMPETCVLSDCSSNSVTVNCMTFLIGVLIVVTAFAIVVGHVCCFLMVSTTKLEAANVVVVYSSPSILLQRGRHWTLRRDMVTSITLWQGGVVLNSGPFSLVVITVPTLFRWLVIYRLQYHFPFASVKGGALKPAIPAFSFFIRMRCWLRKLA